MNSVGKPDNKPEKKENAKSIAESIAKEFAYAGPGEGFFFSGRRKNFQADAAKCSGSCSGGSCK